MVFWNISAKGWGGVAGFELMPKGIGGKASDVAVRFAEYIQPWAQAISGCGAPYVEVLLTPQP